MNAPIDHLPGRLSNTQSTLEADPRLDPRIKQLLEMMGELLPSPEVSIDQHSSVEDCLAYTKSFEAAGELTHPALLESMPTFAGVTSTETVITGVDGNPITLYIDRPEDASVTRPCIVHTHGGGMVMMTATDPNFIRWRRALAAAGMVVVGVEFRNGGGRLGDHPFPAGLNDCASAVQWTYEQRDDLNISGIVISGESGGGNLSIATTLKAHLEGWADKIAGVYACCPYICGAYHNPPAELLSLIENDGYMLGCDLMAGLVKVYDPHGEHAQDPLAWPLQADVEQLRGLPPHVISVNELDPLRDEGLAFYRKLLAAGVPTVGRTVHGTPHAGDLSYPDVTPELYAETLGSLVAFAQRVTR